MRTLIFSVGRLTVELRPVLDLGARHYRAFGHRGMGWCREVSVGPLRVSWWKWDRWTLS